MMSRHARRTTDWAVVLMGLLCIAIFGFVVVGVADVVTLTRAIISARLN